MKQLSFAVAAVPSEWTRFCSTTSLNALLHVPIATTYGQNTVSATIALLKCLLLDIYDHDSAIRSRNCRSGSFEKTIEQVLDDGAWTDAVGNPAWNNETASDQLSVTVKVDDDDTGQGFASQNATIHNVAPKIAKEVGSKPTVALQFDDDGNAIGAELTGSFTDPGIQDFHKVVVTWGDTGASTQTLDPGVLSFTISTGLSGEITDLYPITIDVTDDDTGADTYVIDKFCDCDDEVDTGTGSENTTLVTTQIGPALPPGQQAECQYCQWRRHTGGTFAEMDSHVAGTPVQQAVNTYVNSINNKWVPYKASLDVNAIVGPGGPFVAKNVAPFVDPNGNVVPPGSFEGVAALFAISVDVCGSCGVVVDEWEKKAEYWDGTKWVDEVDPGASRIGPISPKEAPGGSSFGPTIVIADITNTGPPIRIHHTCRAINGYLLLICLMSFP